MDLHGATAGQLGDRLRNTSMLASLGPVRVQVPGSSLLSTVRVMYGWGIPKIVLTIPQPKRTRETKMLERSLICHHACSHSSNYPFSMRALSRLFVGGLARQ